MSDYLIVSWPESQKWMDHPESILIVDPEVAGPSAYMVPRYIVEDERSEKIATPFSDEE